MAKAKKSKPAKKKPARSPKKAAVRKAQPAPRKAVAVKKASAKKRAASGDDPALRALASRAESVYGSPVAIERDAKTGKGTVSVRFFSDSDLVRLLQIMGVDTEL